MDFQRPSRAGELFPHGVNHEQNGRRHQAQRHRSKDGHNFRLRVRPARCSIWLDPAALPLFHIEPACPLQLLERRPQSRPAYTKAGTEFSLAGQVLAPMSEADAVAQVFYRLGHERKPLREGGRCGNNTHLVWQYDQKREIDASAPQGHSQSPLSVQPK